MTFRVGSSYSGRFVGDADATFTVTVVSRAAEFVTITDPMGTSGTVRCRVSRDHEDGEMIRPFGRGSLNPIVRAKRLVAA